MWSWSSSALSKWNSLNLVTSGQSGPLSVMDVLNLWNDDPEEVLLDLGFGCDEPDLSGRIPARFINHQSQARGINLQVFLEAQKNRLDLENPDVSNRFRQLEVLQQVTTAFSSLVESSSSLKNQLGKNLPQEAWERRRHVGMLFRRASKKSLSQIHNHKTQDLTTPIDTSSLCTAPESLQPSTSFGDKKVPLKRLSPGLQETMCLSPLAEEKGVGPNPQPQPQVLSFIGQKGKLRPGPLKEDPTEPKIEGWASESFDMEEILSFDDSSVMGNYTGGAESLVRGAIRTSSCQSDSSGYLEEPFILSLPQQASPGSDLIKALSRLSGGTTDSQSSERPGSPSSSPHNSPFHLCSSSLIASGDRAPLCLVCPSPEPSLLFDPTPTLHLPKYDLQSSDMETPLKQDQSPHVSLSEVVFEYLPPHNSSPEVESTTLSQSPTLPSPILLFSHPPTPSHLQAASLIRESEGKIKLTEVALHENPLCVSGMLSSLLPSSPHLPPSAPFHFPSSFASPPLTESLSQSSKNNQKDSVFSDSDGMGPSDTPTNTQKDQDETLPSLSFQLDKDNPSDLCPLLLDSCKFEEGFPMPSSLSPNPSIPVYQSSLCSISHDTDSLIDPAAGKNSGLTEGSIPQQGCPCSLDDNTDPTPASPVQDVIHLKMDRLSLDIEDTLQRNGKGEGERHTNTVQTQDTGVYISDTKNSAGLSGDSRLASEEVCNLTEIDPQVPSCGLHDELSAETKQEELRSVFKMEINGTESESPRSCLLLHEIPEVHNRTKEEQNYLIEIESLDLVFETSVDGSEDENGDMDAFFQQLDTEGQVYWAEPVHISNPTHIFKESGSFEASDGCPGNSQLPRGSADLDSVSSTGKAMPLFLSSSATMGTYQFSRNSTASSDTVDTLALSFLSPPANPDLKPSSRSVSVQMSSSLSSHIVHRKDVPYMTDSKRTILPSVIPLDTSSPFRAVQAWTDDQIQRNTLIEKLSKGILHTVTNEVTTSMGSSEMTQRPTLSFSSSPSLPLLSSDWQSHDCFSGLTSNYQTVSVSVDTPLQPDKNEEVVKNVNENEKLWEGNQTVTMACCCCSCDHQCICCTQKSYNKQQTLGTIHYSLDDLEEMMLCLQQFHFVLSNMEEQLSEDQTAVYSALSDQDREKIRDIEDLRRAVKQEAGELEMQLKELAHHYDDSLKMKMHRLLDEQSLLCSQLRVFLPGAVPASSSPTPNRTVATQCCLLPRIVAADVQSDYVSSSAWNVDSSRQSPSRSESICEGLGCSPTKADKLDILGFLQKLKESLRHSVNTLDSLE